MNTSFTVEKISDDKLFKEVWRFALTENKMVLDSYMDMSRPTTRHKFSAEWDKRYSRLFGGRDCKIKLEDISVPEWVKENAVKQLVDSITFCSDYQGTLLK